MFSLAQPWREPTVVTRTWRALADVLAGAGRLEADATVLAVVHLTHGRARVVHRRHRRDLTEPAKHQHEAVSNIFMWKVARKKSSSAVRCGSTALHLGTSKMGSKFERIKGGVLCCGWLCVGLQLDVETKEICGSIAVCAQLYVRAGVAARTEAAVRVESVFALRAVLTDVVLAVVLVHAAVLPRKPIRALAAGNSSKVPCFV